MTTGIEMILSEVESRKLAIHERRQRENDPETRQYFAGLEVGLELLLIECNLMLEGGDDDHLPVLR